MGKPICAVPLPPELQRDLPAGTLVFGFDGEVVFRSKNTNANNEPRTYSLMPVTDNELMYERRWNGQSVQDTYLSIEHFHGHIVTMFFFYFPIPKGTVSVFSEKLMPKVKEAAKSVKEATKGSPIAEELYSVAEKMIPEKSGKSSEEEPVYRTAGFAAMSWSTHQWLWLTNPSVIHFMFAGPPSVGKAALKVMLGLPVNMKVLVSNGDKSINAVDQVVTYLRSEMNKKLQQNNDAGGRL